MSSVLGGLIDFGIAFDILLLMMLFYGIRPTGAVLTLPAFVLFAMATALAVGLWLSALNVKYRDVRYTISFLIQFWLLATPVAYPSSIVPQRWRALYGLNPMAGVVEGFRWALLGKTPAPGGMLAGLMLVRVVVLVRRGFYFSLIETEVSDNFLLLCYASSC